MLPGGAWSNTALPQILIGWSTGYRWPLTDMKGLLLFLVAFKVSVGGEEVESLQTVKLTGPECKQILELQQIPSWHPAATAAQLRKRNKSRGFYFNIISVKSLFCLVASPQKDQSLLTPYFSWADREHSQNLSFRTGQHILGPQQPVSACFSRKCRV